MEKCDCPLNELREAVRTFLRWEALLFGSGVVMNQSELDTASSAYNEARSRLRSLVMED